MIFTINSIQNDFVENIYNETILELEDFFNFKWETNKPKVHIVENRQTIDLLREEKTPLWLVGWGGKSKGIFILNRDNFEKESENKYSDDRYKALIKHELVHCFFDVVSSGYRKPAWLSEGVALYLSGQLDNMELPSSFSNFLDFFENTGSGVYKESGFAVKKIIEKFGKDKILRLIKQTKENAKDKQSFEKLFGDVFEVRLSYDIFNK